MLKLHEIPSMENFLKGLEEIRKQQILASENREFPSEDTNIEYRYLSNGVVLPEDKHYLINAEGELSFTGKKFLINEDKEAFPPFSAAEMLLDSENDFKIDYAEVANYYNLNKELAMKENENILSSKEFRPENVVIFTVNQEMKGLKTMLVEQGQDPSDNVEVSTLLDQHFLKIEKLLEEFSLQVDKSSLEDIPKLEKNLLEKVKIIFADLKDGLKELFVDMKDNVRSSIDNRVNIVKTNIHNAVAEKVQKVNDKIKNLTESLDKKYQIIEKEPEKLQKEPVGHLINEEKEITDNALKKEFDSKEQQLEHLYNELTSKEKDLFKQLNRVNIESLDNYFADRSTYDQSKKYEDLVKTFSDESISKVSKLYHENIYTGTDKAPKGKIHMDELSKVEKNLQVAPALQFQKAFGEVKSVVKSEASNLKDPEKSQSLADISPKVDEMERINKQLKKENAGLKTFVKVFKSQHPEVYQKIINTMKGVQPNEQKQENTEVKTEKEVLGL